MNDKLTNIPNPDDEAIARKLTEIAEKTHSQRPVRCRPGGKITQRAPAESGLVRSICPGIDLGRRDHRFGTAIELEHQITCPGTPAIRQWNTQWICLPGDAAQRQPAARDPIQPDYG